MEISNWSAILQYSEKYTIICLGSEEDLPTEKQAEKREVQPELKSLPLESEKLFSDDEVHARSIRIQAVKMLNC